MSILSEASLDFARSHIQKYYDSDFFPRSFEFEAIEHSWDAVKSELMAKNVAKLWATPPRTMASPKPRGGFRVVHQLDPLDVVVYTALACSVAPAVEAARVPIEKNVACSYRFELHEGSLFKDGNGFGEFTAKSGELAKTHTHVLATDVVDFYNQIYLHRLNNAIEHADSALKPIADDIENFLSRINGKVSQGVPVGPAASIIMSEAVMMDIDAFLIGQGVSHTRYVDDFRIFGNSKEQLSSVLEHLSIYLYSAHRLTLASDKTKIIECETYIDEILHNHYELEKIDIFETLEVFNPYSGEPEEVEILVEDEHKKATGQIELLAQKVLERKSLDLGLARALLRKAKAFKVAELPGIIFENFSFFSPVINDVCLYLSAVSSEAFVDHWRVQLIETTKDPAMNRPLCRYWYEWYIANHSALLGVEELRNFVFNGGHVANQARAAIETKNLAWVRDKKADIYNVGGWERRAILRATKILPSDEKDHWLKLTETTSPILLDRWVAKWARETS